MKRVLLAFFCVVAVFVASAASNEVVVYTAHEEL